jgi:integrase/recombinase XerD
MLKVQKRHQAPCTRPEWDQRSCAGKGANCPIVIIGTLQEKRVRLSTAKFLPPDKARDLESARDLALLWERIGRPVRPEEYAPTPLKPADSPEPASSATVDAAISAYLADARDRGNSEATIAKKVGIFERRMIRDPRHPSGALVPASTTSLLWFCEKKGIRFLSELDLNTIREWRGTWNVDSLTRDKRQGQVIGFFWFCERAGWLPRNFAAELTKGLGKIQVKATQTGYFMPGEYAAVLDATYAYSDRPSVDKHNGLNLGGHRIRALTELMRWTGLRIRDAVTLERRRLFRDARTGLWSILVYQKKTGEPVYCPIPPHVAELLLSVPASQKGNANEVYFFWTGEGNHKTITTNWQRSYGKLFKLAALKNADGTPKRCHPHMFRDTFAVEALLSGMRVDEVQVILGHSSVRVTEKHYMPWVRARQASLNRSVVESWAKQGIIPPHGTEPGKGDLKKNAIIEFPAALAR